MPDDGLDIPPWQGENTIFNPFSPVTDTTSAGTTFTDYPSLTSRGVIWTTNTVRRLTTMAEYAGWVSKEPEPIAIKKRKRCVMLRRKV